MGVRNQGKRSQINTQLFIIICHILVIKGMTGWQARIMLWGDKKVKLILVLKEFWRELPALDNHNAREVDDLVTKITTECM